MADAARTRVLVVDHQGLFREGVRTLLATQADFEVVGEATDASTAVLLARERRPHVILLDLTARRTTALEAVSELARIVPSSHVLVLSSGDENDDMVATIQRGAHGIMSKDSDSRMLFKAIRSVAAGQYWLQRSMVTNLAGLVRQVRAQPDPEWRHPLGLTLREFSIVSAVAAGDSNRDIAQQMAIAVNTVKHHLTRIFDKLGVRSRIELAMFAVTHGLVADRDVAGLPRRIPSSAPVVLERGNDAPLPAAKGV